METLPICLVASTGKFVKNIVSLNMKKAGLTTRLAKIIGRCAQSNSCNHDDILDSLKQKLRFERSQISISKSSASNSRLNITAVPETDNRSSWKKELEEEPFYCSLLSDVIMKFPYLSMGEDSTSKVNNGEFRDNIYSKHMDEMFHFLYYDLTSLYHSTGILSQSEHAYCIWRMIIRSPTPKHAHHLLTTYGKILREALVNSSPKLLQRFFYSLGQEVPFDSSSCSGLFEVIDDFLAAPIPISASGGGSASTYSKIMESLCDVLEAAGREGAREKAIQAVIYLIDFRVKVSCGCFRSNVRDADGSFDSLLNEPCTYIVSPPSIHTTETKKKESKKSVTKDPKKSTSKKNSKSSSPDSLYTTEKSFGLKAVDIYRHHHYNPISTELIPLATAKNLEISNFLQNNVVSKVVEVLNKRPLNLIGVNNIQEMFVFMLVLGLPICAPLVPHLREMTRMTYFSMLRANFIPSVVTHGLDMALSSRFTLSGAAEGHYQAQLLQSKTGSIERDSVKATISNSKVSKKKSSNKKLKDSDGALCTSTLQVASTPDTPLTTIGHLASAISVKETKSKLSDFIFGPRIRKCLLSDIEVYDNLGNQLAIFSNACVLNHEEAADVSYERITKKNFLVDDTPDNNINIIAFIEGAGSPLGRSKGYCLENREEVDKVIKAREEAFGLLREGIVQETSSENSGAVDVSTIDTSSMHPVGTVRQYSGPSQLPNIPYAINIYNRNDCGMSLKGIERLSRDRTDVQCVRDYLRSDINYYCKTSRRRRYEKLVLMKNHIHDGDQQSAKNGEESLLNPRNNTDSIEEAARLFVREEASARLILKALLMPHLPQKHGWLREAADTFIDQTIGTDAVPHTTGLTINMCTSIIAMLSVDCSATSDVSEVEDDMVVGIHSCMSVLTKREAIFAKRILLAELGEDKVLKIEEAAKRCMQVLPVRFEDYNLFVNRY